MVTIQQDGLAEFAFFRPAARSVALAGDFAGGRSTRLTMQRDERGWWRAQLNLNPGEYHFKYLVDGGIWEADFAAYGVEPESGGGWSSVMWIDAEAQTSRGVAMN